MTFKEYQRTIKLAYLIVDIMLYPNGIKSYKQFCGRINKAGEINLLLNLNLKI